MPKLYALSDELRTIQMLLEQGIDDAELYSRLERVEDGIESRLLGLAALVREHELDAAAAKQEAERLAARADAFAKSADRLKAWMQRFMEVAKLDKPIRGRNFTVSLKKCPPSVRVLDEGSIPQEFWVRPEPPEPRIDKKGILDAFRKDGEVVQGCDIIDDKRTISIR